MKIKFDENIPDDLKPFLAGLGHDVETVFDEGMRGADDNTLWEAAQKEQRFFITQDLHFSDIRKYPPGSHSGILIIRFQKSGLDVFIKAIMDIFRDVEKPLLPGSFAVLSDSKLRIFYS